MKFLKLFVILAVLIALAGAAIATDTAILEVKPKPTVASTALQAGTALKSSTSGDVNYALLSKYRMVLAVNVTNVNGNLTLKKPKVTIKHGDNPPAFRSGIGDLNISIPGNGTYFVGPLESARFVNKTGYLKVYGTNITNATVSVIEVMP